MAASSRFAESVVEDAALEWLRALGSHVAHDPDIAPGELGAERNDYGQVVLERRPRDALARLNPTLPAQAIDDAFRNTRPLSSYSIIESSHWRPSNRGRSTSAAGRDANVPQPSGARAS